MFLQTWQHVILTPTSNRSIDIDIYGPWVDYEVLFMRSYGVPTPQPIDVASGTYLLLQALSRLPRLQHLKLNIPAQYVEEYEKIVHHINISPIKATRVTLGQFTQNILRHMSKVNDVSLYGWQMPHQDSAQKRMMGAIIGLQLEHIELTSGRDVSRHLEGTIDEFSFTSNL
jgi:hypothetical protein